MARWEQQILQVAAPSLFHYEIVAALRKQVYRGILVPEEAVIIRGKLLSVPVQLFMNTPLLRRAYELATQFNRPTAYDSQYLAVSERLNCVFWTADDRLFNAVQPQLSWVKWVGNFES
jgi:predicted nucleic acid-binding protein